MLVAVKNDIHSGMAHSSGSRLARKHTDCKTCAGTDDAFAKKKGWLPFTPQP